MKAVFVTGGKQYTANVGDVLFIEKLNAEAEETVVFDQVLFVGEGADAKFGTPVVEGAKVEAKVIKNGKGKKLNIITYKPKKGSARRMGHRQPYTKVEITNIVG
ncbi:MAG: 50S ribosomal protein L21 [Oscillospiraceae bacterium]|nr:50S ribosomal protein L21 [Oscillospiraceae bacterium]